MSMVSNETVPHETTTPSGRPKPGESLGRRQEIVALAMELFSQKGVQTTSIREIASQAGILSGSLYSHFGSKTEILDLGLRPYTEVYLKVVRQIVDTEESSETKIYELIRQSFVLMGEYRAATIVTNRDWEYLSTLEGFGFLREFYAGVEEAYLKALREAVANGALAPDVDPRAVQRLLGYIMLGMARQGNADSKRRLDPTDYVHRMLFGGLSTPRASNAATNTV